MNRRTTFFLVALAAALAFLLGQRTEAQRPKPGVPGGAAVSVQGGQAPAAPVVPGRYQLTRLEGSLAVLLDTATGRTWHKDFGRGGEWIDDDLPPEPKKGAGK